ncbi:MAG: hypothetical protein OER95_19245, partial [Acidimicrobiia bacterium]|nr:hypothetical protein [Acidimicrobiia bacterium]
RLALAAVVAAAIVVAIATPLYQASVSTIRSNNDLAEAEAIVDIWLGDSNLRSTVQFDNGIVSVELRGFENPPDQAELENLLAQRFPDLTGPPLVQWIRTQPATTTTTAPPSPDQQLEVAIEEEVDNWLGSLGFDYRVNRVTISDGIVTIDATGTGVISSADLRLLSERLNSLSEGTRPRLNYSFQETIEIDSDVVSPLELVTESIEAETKKWAVTVDLQLRNLLYDGDRLEIELAGPDEPSTLEIRRLRAVIDTLDEDGYELELFFVQRVPVTTTVLPPTTTTTIGE